jgi:hypothetical protein
MICTVAMLPSSIPSLLTPPTFIHYTSFPSSPTCLSPQCFDSLEELSLVRYNAAVVQDRIVLRFIECTSTCHLTWYRPVKSIETMTSDLRHDPKEADAKSACSSGPEQASERRGNEGT